jgi:hypothetical protein
MLKPSGTVTTTFVVFAFSFSFGTEMGEGRPAGERLRREHRA